MSNIVVVDGQGGKIGIQIIEKLKEHGCSAEITAIGTNSIAASAMKKAGADNAATGENAIVVACRTADLVVGPIGIVIADSLLGEITPKMAIAIGQSNSKRILLPINLCNNYIVGINGMPISALVSEAVKEVMEYIKKLD